MSDRTAQARTEAEEEWPRNGHWGIEADRQMFLEGAKWGVEWADANHPAVDALARVRELHQQIWYGQLDYCGQCVGFDGAIWPCATYQATEVDG